MQSIVNGFQHEQPDYWLTFGNPWEIERFIVSAHRGISAGRGTEALTCWHLSLLSLHEGS
jgi:glucan phosphorylase